MVASCCICGIEKGSAQDDNLVFHRFPKDENLRAKWWEVTGKKYASAQVCSKHFRPEDYKNYEDTNLTRRILKNSAVPQKNNNLDTVEFVQNCFFSTCTDFSSAESKSESLESVEQIKIEPENNSKLKSDDSTILRVGQSISPQVIFIVRDFDSDVTFDISRAVSNTNVGNDYKNIESVESNDTLEKAIENNSKMINYSTIKPTTTDGINKTVELVEITDTIKRKNTDETECLADENENEKINDSTVEDDFIDESDDEIFNILSNSSDDKTFSPRKRKIESYNKQKNEKKTSKQKRLQQIKKQRYQSDTLGVTRKEDFTNESAWIRFQNFIDETRAKHSILLSENRRLKQKITFYQHLLRYMNKKRMMSADNID